jgi:type 1 fimbria pilin
MFKKIAGIALLVGLSACGGSDSPTDPNADIVTQRFSGTIVDPTSCNCGPTGQFRYPIVVSKAGVVEATATWNEPNAVVITRLLDNSLNTIHAVSTANGTTARFSQQVAPGQYQVDIFLNQGPGRTATFNLEVKHP